MDQAGKNLLMYFATAKFQQIEIKPLRPIKTPSISWMETETSRK
jgi:hypothetical protein